MKVADSITLPLNIWLGIPSLPVVVSFRKSVDIEVHSHTFQKPPPFELISTPSKNTDLQSPEVGQFFNKNFLTYKIDFI